MKLPHMLVRAVMAGTGLCVWLTLGSAAAAQTRAQGEALSRIIAGASAGVPLRLTRNVDTDQSTFAPPFTDALLGYVFRGDERVQHGAGLGLSINLTHDGGFTEPVVAGQQLVLMPAYLLAWNPEPNIFGLAHAGLPMAVSGGTTVGLELAGAIGYRWLAGVGTFAEFGIDLFRGLGSTVHPSISLELGVLFEYEVLP